MRLTVPFILGAFVIVIAAACGGGPPPPPPGPDPDSIAREQARRDSAAVAARQQSVADSLQRARAEVERMERERRRADSLATIRAETEAVREMLARTVHFDFDRSNIRPGQDTEVLEQKLAVLQANPNLQLEIVGHCDERGTDEYNMALGNRRALSARKFLTDRGIAEARITVRSRGEEEPLEAGHNEAAWARNRRDEFRITGGGDALRRPGM